MARFSRYVAVHPEEAQELLRMQCRELPEGWDADMPKFRPEEGMVATRKASQKVIQWAAARVPQLVSGSADLEPSTLTPIDA